VQEAALRQPKIHLPKFFIHIRRMSTKPPSSSLTARSSRSELQPQKPQSTSGFSKFRKALTVAQSMRPLKMHWEPFAFSRRTVWVFPIGNRSDRCIKRWIFAFWTGRIRFSDCGHSGALLSRSSCRTIFQGAKGCPRSGMNWCDSSPSKRSFLERAFGGSTRKVSLRNTTRGVSAFDDC